MGFCHLHLHSEYSLLDGAIKINKLFPRLKELNMNSVAITEHGNMLAIIRKYQLAKKHNIKLIFGFEAYIVNDINVKIKGEKRYHLVLLAKNNIGYQNLMKLVSIANSEGMYYKPRIDKNILKKYSEGLVGLSACIANDIAQSVIHNDIEKSKKLIQEYIDIFGKDDFYLEIQNHGIPEEKIVQKHYLEFAKEFNLKVVATTDSHYLLKEDKKAHEVLLCIQTNNTIDNPKRFKFNGENYYITSEEEMINLFSDCPEVISNTQEISDKCNVELDIGNHIFPNFKTPNDIPHEKYLSQLCKEGLKEKYGNKDNLEEAKKRMDYELSIINKMNFNTYFLIVRDFVKAATDQGQITQCRGSGAGSIVAYLLGITQLEPLKLNLLFERFLNPERISLPDFDIDFSNKESILKYVQDKYGHEKVSLICNYGTMGAKSVFKDVSRAFNIPFTISNDISKYINEKTIDKSIKNDETKELINFQKQYPEIIEIAQKLEGTVRHKGIHACGVVWGKSDITDYIPVYKKANNTITQIDGPEVETAGLVKFDFLGVETLNIIKNILSMINKTNKWLENISIEDDNVYQMLRDGDTAGVFQLESPGMQKTLKLIRPEGFDDIIAIVALYRPGPMEYLEVYANRKDGIEKVNYPHPKAEEILKLTYGIMVYQEQVMQLSQSLAGFSMGQADILRKAIGKKKLDLMMQMEEKFKTGCINHSGMQEKDVNQLWDDIVKFASYSFNKSHAAVYALTAYRTAYLKYYYPVEFITAQISANTNDTEKMAFYLNEARKKGIKILCPDINFSKEDFSIEKFNNQNIRFGLSGIKNVGHEAMQEIINNRPYKTFQDFINKVDLSKINKRVLKNLISVGAFDELPHNRAQLLAVYENIKKEDNKNKQMTLFGTVAKNTIYPDIDDITLIDKLNIEKELLGICVTASPIDLYAESKFVTFTKKNMMKDDRSVRVFGLIDGYKQIYTKNGDEMAFIRLKKDNDYFDIIVFPNTFKEYRLKREFNDFSALIVTGVYNLSNDNIIAEKLQFPRIVNNHQTSL